MAYSTDKDNPLLILRACYRPSAIRHMLCSLDERRTTLHEQRAKEIRRPVQAATPALYDDLSG
jgi:hypothetical protein